MTFAERGYNVRFAEPADSEAFVRWAIQNEKIDVKDIADSLKENNPTCVVLVVEKEGVPIVFAPFYCTLTLAYLGFNPDCNDMRARLDSLEVMKRAMSAFALMHGVREIDTFTSEDQRVAQWARKHGFIEEPRAIYRCRIPSEGN